MERGRLVCGGDVCMGLEPFFGDFRGSCSPAEGLGRTSIGPLSESDEEEEREEEDPEERDGGQTSVFERDCTELDISLIEENWKLSREDLLSPLTSTASIQLSLHHLLPYTGRPLRNPAVLTWGAQA